MDDFVVSARASTVPPVVQWLGGMSLVIVWTDFDRGRLKAATFGVSGDPLRTTFDVNDAELAHSYPVVAAIPGSFSPGFVVAWTTETRKVKLQRFNGDARPVGGIIQVNTMEADPEHAPAIASLTDGNFAVTWGDFGVGAIRGQSVQGRTASNSVHYFCRKHVRGPSHDALHDAADGCRICCRLAGHSWGSWRNHPLSSVQPGRLQNPGRNRGRSMISD